jgi:hypothetical protein
MKKEKRRKTRRKLMMDAENKGEDSGLDSVSPITKVTLMNGASRSIIISYPSS